MAPGANRYSAVFPLMARGLSFNKVTANLFSVADTGDMYPVTFAVQAGGEPRHLLMLRAITVENAAVEGDGGRACIKPVGPPGASVEFIPTKNLLGGNWYLHLTYASTASFSAPVLVDRGSGYLSQGDVRFAAGTHGDALIDLGGSRVQKIRLDIPPQAAPCLDDLQVGQLLRTLPGVTPGRTQTLVSSGDDFWRNGTPTPLGTDSSRMRWMTPNSTWTVSSGSAYVSIPGFSRSLAVSDMPRAEGAVDVRMTRVTQGAGVVFRYRDPDNYWAVVAVPGYATWAIVNVVEGREAVIANTGLSPIADGTTVTVRTKGDAVDVAFNSSVVRSFTDGTLSDATGVGITAEGYDTVARFGDFWWGTLGPTSG